LSARRLRELDHHRTWTGQPVQALNPWPQLALLRVCFAAVKEIFLGQSRSEGSLLTLDCDQRFGGVLFKNANEGAEPTSDCLLGEVAMSFRRGIRPQRTIDQIPQQAGVAPVHVASLRHSRHQLCKT